MNVIKKPVITEKMNLITEKCDKFMKYGFIVAKDANKLQIKEAIEALYSVSVVEVKTMNYAGKSKSRFTKAGVINGKVAAFKKAVVTLAEGDSIDFYSNI